MSAPTDVGAEKEARGARRGVGAAGAAIIILLAAFGIYYFVYAERQTAYFAHRNLRILDTVAAQIEESDKTTHTPVETLFSQSVLSVFETVLLADDAGNVVKPEHARSIATLVKLQTTGTWQQPKDLDLKALQQHADHHRILLHGDTYHLFTQPLKIQDKTYVLAGLVSGTRFNKDSLSISYTLLLAVLAALLLTVFAMPYLKLKLISKLHRVRLSDVLVLGICTMCGISVLTVALLDLVTYRRLRSQCDMQLRHLSTDINTHVRKEIDGALDALTYLDRNIAPMPGQNRAITGPVLAGDPIRNYPYLQSMFRIDPSGTITERWSAPNEKNRALGVDVSDRDYFKDLKFGREWSDDVRGKYTLNSLHSLTTGETQAVIARHASNPTPTNFAVALGIPMLSLINTVVAGDCHYVVVDNDGQVLFHSESQRNLAENFFAETDYDRALRAAVAGRQNELLDIRYWGDDQRAFVAPIPDTPWTVITFRNKLLLRTLNVEMIMITIVFMILYALGCAMTLAIIALVRPSYRAPWLWPTERREREYRRLIYAFVFIAIAFGVSIYAIRPKQLLLISLALPLIAMLLTFLRLRRVRGAFALAGVIALAGAVLTWLAVTTTSTAAGMTEPDLIVNPIWVRVVILFFGTLGILAALLPPITEREATAVLRTQRYVGVGTMLIVLMAILPTTAFFKAAYKIEIESFIKYGQLRIARGLEARTDAIRKKSVDYGTGDVSPGRMSENLDVYYDFFFATGISRIETPLPQVLECENRFKWPRLSPALRALFSLRGLPATEASVLPSFLEPLLPQYSDDSVAMRELHHDSSRDDQWQWSRCGEDLDLHVNSVHGPRTFIVSQLPYFGLRFERKRALLPYAQMFKPETHGEDPDVEPEMLTQAVGGTALLFVLVAYCALIYAMIKFVLHHVFLVDLREPHELAPDEKIGKTFGGNLLLLARDRASALLMIERTEFIEVQLADLQPHPRESWSRIMTTIDEAPAGRGVLITDFDAPAVSADFAKTKLRFIERLIANHGRNVVAITLTSPWALLDEASEDAPTHERWAALLDCFEIRIEDRRRRPRRPDDSVFDAKDAILPAARRLLDAMRARRFVSTCKESVRNRVSLMAIPDSFDGSQAHALALIARETDGYEFLEQLGEDLRAHDIRGQEQIYDELGERAAAFYSGLWAASSRQEKMVLLNVATDGFANAKDRQILRRLMARGLVTRDPNLCVMNETFRRFVCRHDRVQEGLVEDSGPNAWDKLQKPLAITVACFAIFFFSTQREMFDVTMGVVTGLAGGIPAFMRIVGLFLDPRSAVKAASAS